MAIGPRPLVAVQGTAHTVTHSETVNRRTGEATPVAHVQVLTDGGGFLEVYYGSDDLGHLPVQGARVHVRASVDSWNRKTADGQRQYAALLCAFDQNLSLPASSESFASV